MFDIYFQDALAYRASGLIWITTDVVTAITMPLVWAADSKGADGAIAGFNSSDFVLYYLCVLMVGSFITSHIMWELSTEIKDGQFSVQLIRPVSFYQMTFMRNISWRMMRSMLFAPIFVIMLWAYRPLLGDAQVYLGWETFASVVLGHFVSFNFVFMMSMLALFVQEAQSIFELYYVPMLFLSGQLFPIAVLPQWAQNAALFFPFYFTTGVPAEIVVGRLSGTVAHQMLAGQLAWAVGSYVMSRVLWKHGLKHYTAVGM